MQLGRPRERQEVVEQLGEPLDLVIRELGRLGQLRIVAELAAQSALEQLELRACAALSGLRTSCARPADIVCIAMMPVGLDARARAASSFSSESSW